ncbi:hypothetical protein [Burkholderia cenocepacia]|uniref:hypothetical protein n=1 Tax=Burkholderia cenocepacia TaxID=95486 RepID=UPI0022307891|nr:hypothetical protein [Burkholderia cenocepacia]
MADSAGIAGEPDREHAVDRHDRARRERGDGDAGPRAGPREQQPRRRADPMQREQPFVDLERCMFGARDEHHQDERHVGQRARLRQPGECADRQRGRGSARVARRG